MELINQKEALGLLSAYKIPFFMLYPAKNISEAIRIATKISYPVVLKAASEQITHKSDIGGVITGIRNDAELKEGYAGIMKIKERVAGIDGVYVQKMLNGKELIIGMKRDSAFGPVIMFGTGGVFVEVMKDVSFRVAPVNKREAIAMIREIKAYPVLKGIRGTAIVNIDGISKIICNLSRLSLKNSNIKQIDLNPVIADEKGAAAVDVRMME